MSGSDSERLEKRVPTAMASEGYAYVAGGARAEETIRESSAG